MLSLTFVFLLALLAPTRAFQTAWTMNQVSAIVSALSEEYGAENTLVVFDIDNTLLMVNQDLGSDAWYRWQSGLAKTEPGSALLVAEDTGGILDVQRLLFELSDMKPPENETPDLVAQLKERGHPIMALTSRNPNFRSATLRELADFGYEFSSAPRCGAPLCVTHGIIGGDAVKRAAQQSTTVFPRVDELVGTSPRPISYGDGVMMVAGQNKGVMLQLLLASSASDNYRSIIFVDDGKRNVEHVDDAFKDDPRAVSTIYYDRLEADVQAFQSDPKRQQTADKSWRAVSGVVCEHFRRFCAVPAP
jgi:hypothetical protein